MPETGHRPPRSVRVAAVAIVAVGVAVNTGFDSPFRTPPALLLMALGVAALTNAARDAGTAGLRRAAKRWWLVAFAAFLPYGLSAAPDGESAAAVGEAFSGPVVGLAVESLAGATVICAVAMTVLYGFAQYGIHPGRPSPEERVLTGDD